MLTGGILGFLDLAYFKAAMFTCFSPCTWCNWGGSGTQGFLPEPFSKVFVEYVSINLYLITDLHCADFDFVFVLRTGWPDRARSRARCDPSLLQPPSCLRVWGVCCVSSPTSSTVRQHRNDKVRTMR